MNPSPPPGFKRWTKGGSAVTDAWEPIFEKVTDDTFGIGFFANASVLNRRGLLHGGHAGTETIAASFCRMAVACIAGPRNTAPRGRI